MLAVARIAAAMAESSSRTLVCSVLFAELAGYAQLPADEQLRRKRALSARVAQEVAQVPRPDRVVHEIETGTAVAFLVDAEAALVAAIGLHAAAGELPLRLGLGLGTVHVVTDLGGRTALVGEAVNDAQHVAAQAAAGQVLAARAFRDIVSRLSPEHAALFEIAALRTDAQRREHELFEVRIPARAAAAPARAQEASVFDAGPHLIVSGYERAAVQKSLDALAAKGARVISPIQRVGDKWMASCDHPEVRMNDCKVEKFGFTSIVTGPSRQAVAAKVDELLGRGARLAGEIEQDGDTWTAVCDSSGAG
jgi:class 3 adenylate cyclase